MKDQKSSKKVERSKRLASYSKGKMRDHRSNPTPYQKKMRAEEQDRREWETLCNESFEALPEIQAEINTALKGESVHSPFVPETSLPVLMVDSSDEPIDRRFVRLHIVRNKKGERIGVKTFCVVEKDSYSEVVFCDNADEVLWDATKLALHGYKEIKSMREEALDVLDDKWIEYETLRDQGVSVDVVAVNNGYKLVKGDIHRASSKKQLAEILEKLVR